MRQSLTNNSVDGRECGQIRRSRPNLEVIGTGYRRFLFFFAREQRTNERSINKTIVLILRGRRIGKTPSKNQHKYNTWQCVYVINNPALTRCLL